MLRTRVFPVILLNKNASINTVKFKQDRYLGDPINAVRIYNEKLVDEISIFDITEDLKSPNFKLIKRISKECRMPSTYGGAVTSDKIAENLVNIGYEKVSICSEYLKNPSILDECSSRIGSQSVVITLNIRKNIFGKEYSAISHKIPNKKYPLKEIIEDLKKRNFGELIINSIDYDGMMQGYDQKVIALIDNKIINEKVISLIGGAGCNDDFIKMNKIYPNIGFGASSYFAYKGNMKAVLINYKHPFIESSK